MKAKDRHRPASAPVSGADAGRVSRHAAQVGDVDRVIAEFAAAQHGVVARRQLLEAGVGPRGIQVRQERGTLHGVHLGVYAVGQPNLTLRGRWTAAVLACGPGAVLSNRSAAACHGLLSERGNPKVTRPGKFRPRRGISARFGSVPADERTFVDGISVTSVPRTILDLAASEPRREVERALHEAEVRQLTDALSVPDLLRRYPGREGTPLLAEIAGRHEWAGVTENDLEDAFAELVESHGLSRPQYNPDLFIGERFLRPDCAWPEQQLIVELDGGQVHATRAAFEADRHRDRQLVAIGWTVVRVTWLQLNEEPSAIVSDIQSALQAARPASTPE